MNYISIVGEQFDIWKAQVNSKILFQERQRDREKKEKSSIAIYHLLFLVGC